ncbi:MAG: hypothetical protein N3B01_06705 [Verrucomicrobiae bacterium]|nr:hypothetical protein [Verrucomicrobiae bacterium]
MKPAIHSTVFTAVLTASAVCAQDIKPIESIWLLTIPRFPGSEEQDGALAEKIKQWHKKGVFDAFSLLIYPPTFVCEKDVTKAANKLIAQTAARFIITTLPVGNEGWESSNNPRLAKRLPGTHYDPGRAMSQVQWLERMKTINAEMWGWVPEHTARIPTPPEAAHSAGEFAKFAKARHKTVVIWLTAQALSRGHRELMLRICDATRAHADFYCWMDVEEETLRAGESKWRETMAEVLDEILALTPKEKTVIQWINHPKWPAKDVDGTKTYIGICQSKGINRFGMLTNLGAGRGLLDQEPWRRFYSTLPKARGIR